MKPSIVVAFLAIFIPADAGSYVSHLTLGWKRKDWPNLQALLYQKDNNEYEARVFWYGDDDKFYYSKTSNFVNLTAETVTYTKDSVCQFAYDDTNRCGWFNNSKGGCIRLSNSDNEFSTDFGSTWERHSRDVLMDEGGYDLDPFASLFWDKRLNRWVSLSYYDVVRVMLSEPDLVHFWFRFTVNDLEVLKPYKKPLTTDLFVILQNDRPVYCFLIKEMESKLFHYLLGNLDYLKQGEEALTFVPTSDFNVFDYSTDVQDIAIASDGEREKPTRLAIVGLANQYYDATSNNQTWATGIPRDVKVEIINGKQMLIQTPSIHFKANAKPTIIQKLRITGEVSLPKCKGFVSYMISAEFQMTEGVSRVGIFVKGSLQGAARGLVGYDTKEKSFFYDRSRDVPLKDDYLKRISAKYPNVGEWFKMTVIVDRNLVETFTNGGAIWISCYDFSNLGNFLVGLLSENGSTEAKNIAITIYNKI